MAPFATAAPSFFNTLHHPAHHLNTDTTPTNAHRNAYTPPEAFGQNVEAIINTGSAAGVKHWLIISPPPCYEITGTPVRFGRGCGFGLLGVLYALGGVLSTISCALSLPLSPPNRQTPQPPNPTLPRVPATWPTPSCTWTSSETSHRARQPAFWTFSGRGRGRRTGRRNICRRISCI